MEWYFAFRLAVSLERVYQVLLLLAVSGSDGDSISLTEERFCAGELLLAGWDVWPAGIQAQYKIKW